LLLWYNDYVVSMATSLATCHMNSSDNPFVSDSFHITYCKILNFYGANIFVVFFFLLVSRTHTFINITIWLCNIQNFFIFIGSCDQMKCSLPHSWVWSLVQEHIVGALSVCHVSYLEHNFWTIEHYSMKLHRCVDHD